MDAHTLRRAVKIAGFAILCLFNVNITAIAQPPPNPDLLLDKLTKQLDANKILEPPDDNVYATLGELGPYVRHMTPQQIDRFSGLLARVHEEVDKSTTNQSLGAPLQAPPAQPSPLPQSDEAKETQEAQLRLMMQQAENAWSRNDVSAARRLWEYAANKGSGAAARRLGESYDPNVMRSIGGLSPNKDEALRWYQKAESLGDREASSLRTRLAR